MKTFDVIGYPTNLGYDENGNELTPSILRQDGCCTSAKHHVNDLDDLPCTPRATIVKEKFASYPKIKYLKPILTASRFLAERVMHSTVQQHIPLCVGRNHVMAFDSVAGVGLAKGTDSFAVVYIDAHGGFSTETIPGTGNMHGMHLPYLIGCGKADITSFWGVSPLLRSQNIYLLGVRTLDPGEIEMVAKPNMYIRGPERFNAPDPVEVIIDILSDIKRKSIDHIHLSFSMDVVDPEYTPGIDVPEGKGISSALAYIPIGLCMRSDFMKSMDIVELNTNLDQGYITERAMQQILKITLE